MQDTPIDLSRYTGLWYELARTPNPHQDNTPSRAGKRFSPCTATTATYTARSAGTIAIRNVCTREASDGTAFEDTATGIARVVAGSGGRKLKIAFGPLVARMLQRLISLGGFDYWIYAVGEVGPGAPYPWAVVSGPKRDFLFLLTRERMPSEQSRQAILAAANKAGLPVDRLVFRQQAL